MKLSTFKWAFVYLKLCAIHISKRSNKDQRGIINHLISH